jgi:hypothetical protein
MTMNRLLRQDALALPADPSKPNCSIAFFGGKRIELVSRAAAT